jgi:hypothetical protein
LTNEKKPLLLPLHPKELSDEEFSVYEVEFEKVLSDPFCRNIALSGPYGAGKSSVMEKVKRKQQMRGEKWIAISLATFGETNSEQNSKSEETGSEQNSGNEETISEQNSKSTLSQNTVEAEILRQMVHKIGTSMAPKSRFRKLSDHNPAADALMAALVLAFALLTAYLANAYSRLFSLQLSCIEGLAFLAWLVIAGAGIYRLIRTNVISKMVRRFKIFEAEFEITPSDSKSPYERCADEIVYLLNASKVNAVVFEDLDRFDSMAIFERMRSLNSLANDSRFSDAEKKWTEKGRQKTEKPLRFFFLVRDSLFKNPHDRTKFFDYVIPVVPYIDPNSALDIFRNALDGVGITVDEGFLYQLSSYIDDPRIIHDIANEAHHYKKALFETRSFADGDSERLIALLAYKSLFPKDFEYLQVGRGYLHEVLNGKQRLIARLTEDGETEYEKLQNELEDIKRQLKVSEDELICMFGALGLTNIVQHLRGFNNSGDFDPHSFLETARKDPRASQRFKELLQQLKSNEQYQTRLLEVRNDAGSRSNAIRARQKELRDKSETLQPMTIKQLIDELPDANDLFNFSSSDIGREMDFEELSMNAVLESPFFPMLRFLVSSGYIDESYRRYISNFYSDTLCAEDDDFLSSIKQAKPIDFLYQPKNPNEIVRRMGRGEFSRIGIRNPWLVSALFDSKDEYKIDSFMLSVKRSGGVRYLAGFIASEQFTPEIFTWIPIYFEDIISSLLSSDKISAGDKRCFCKRCLVNRDEVPLFEMDYDVFNEYINSDPRFLEEDPRFDNSEIEEGLNYVGYSAEAIDFPSASSTLLDFVYDNRLFMPAPSIINGYLNLKFGASESLSLGTLITEVLKLPDCPIKDVVSENMEYFVSNVTKESRVPLKEASESVVSVLNEKSIQVETAKAFIEALTGVEIEDVNQIDSADYRNSLLAAQLVKCSADNVVSFYRWAENSITDDLARLIEAKGAPKDLNAAKCKEAEVDTADIVGKIIKCKEISVENKKMILAGCGFKFPSFDIDELDIETVKAMLETKTIEMNCDMLEKFRACRPDLELDYILSDLDGFLALIDIDSSDGPEWEIEKDEVTNLLESNIDTSKKLAALSCFEGTIRLDKGYEAEVNTAIVAEHFDSSDMASLPSYYEGATKEFRSQIAKAFAMYDEKVITDESEFGLDLLCDSLKHLKEDRVRSLRLLVWYFEKHENEIGRDDAKECFETAELEDYAKLIDGFASMVPKSNIDDKMLLILGHLGMCGTISPEVNTEGLRKVYPKGYKRAK